MLLPLETFVFHNLHIENGQAVPKHMSIIASNIVLWSTITSAPPCLPYFVPQFFLGLAFRLFR